MKIYGYLTSENQEQNLQENKILTFLSNEPHHQMDTNSASDNKNLVLPCCNDNSSSSADKKENFTELIDNILHHSINV